MTFPNYYHLFITNAFLLHLKELNYEQHDDKSKNKIDKKCTNRIAMSAFRWQYNCHVNETKINFIIK